MRSSTLLRRLYEARVRLRVHDGSLRSQAPPDTDPALLEAARQGRDGLLALLTGRLREAPLSAEQERVWLFEQLSPGSRAYVVPAAAWLDGPLRPEVLAGAVRAAGERHDILRSAFRLAGDFPLQEPAAGLPRLQVVDLRHLPPAEHDRAALAAARSSLDPPLDLGQGDVWRPCLVRVRDDRALLTLACHHLAADAVTIASLLDLVLAGPGPGSARVPQYADYAVASRSSGGPREQAVAYWRARMAEAPPPCTVPTDEPRPAAPSLRGAHLARPLPAALPARLEAAAGELGVRPFALVSAALHVLLWQYTREPDLVVGYPVSTRPPEHTGLPGFFAQTLVQRARLAGRDTIAHTVRSLGQAIDDGLAHADPGVEAALGNPSPSATGGGGLPFHVLVGYPGPSLAPRRYGPLTATPFLFDHGGAKLDLELYVCEDGHGLSAVLRYDTGLYREATARRALDHYVLLLEAMTEAPWRVLAELPTLDAAGRREVLDDLNATAVAHPTGLLHEPILEQVRARPERVAVVDGEERLTYGELHDRAARTAAALVEAGAGPGAVVGICAERSTAMVTGLLAILLAGGAYLPLDPELPDDRLADMVEQAGVTVVLAQDRQHARGVAAGARTVLSLERVATCRDPLLAPAPLQPDALAYVLFTSGSTGRPKGVMCTHQGIVNRLHWMQRQFALGPHEAVLHKTPVTFDVSVWELFWPLWTGARLVLARPDGHRDADHLAAVIRGERVSVVHFVPSMLRAVLQAGALREQPSLRVVVCSGEALDAGLVREFQQTCDAELHNLYGPTEAAVDVTHAPCTGPVPARVPIGRPIDNTRVYILDEEHRLVPRGGVGQLFIAGVQLARGYIGRPDLTARQFVPDPFHPGERAYATGDLARLSPDGQIEFWGRADHQVKIRGQRIELGEVEAVLLEHPGVSSAAVVVAGDQRQQLVGYVQPHEWSFDARELREHLERRLPGAMVPAQLVPVERMPATSSGKVDRRALPAPPSHADEPAAERPASPEEHALVAVCAGVLGVEDVDVGRGFPALGGDSIASIAVVSLLRERGYRTTVAEVFRAPSLRVLAAGLRRARAAEAQPEPFALLAGEDQAACRGTAEDAFPLSAQLLTLAMESERDGEYLVYTTSVRLRSPYDGAALRRAYAWLLARHPFLRSSLDLAGCTEPVQLVHHQVEARFDLVDLRVLGERGSAQRFEAWLEEERRRPFRWDDPPLVRLSVHRTSDSTFLLTLSEPFLDGWSATNALVDLLGAYDRELEGAPQPRQAAPEPPYSTFVAAERAASADQSSRRFWHELAGGAQWRRLAWPATPAGQHEPRRRRVELRIDPGVSARVRALADREQVPLKSLCLAAHLAVIGELTGTTDVTTALMANGRPEVAGAEHAVGLFLNANVLRVDTSGATWADLARRSFDAEAGALPHRRYPYAQLVAELDGNRLTDAILNFTDFYPYRELAGAARVEVLEVVASDQTYFPLTVHCRVHPVDRQLRVALEFAGGTFHRWQLPQICERYELAFSRLAQDPDAALDEVSLETPRERRLRSGALRGARAPLPAGSLDELFGKISARYPGRVALTGDDGTLTFAEVARRADALAAAIAAAGTGRVGIHLERSVGSVVAYVAALRAGVSFVPLDAELPAARVAQLAARAGLRVAVSGTELPAVAALRRIDPAAATAASRPPRTPAADPEREACLLFTSGSTGEPRGVVVPHRALLNRLGWYWRRFPFAADDRTCHKGPLSFVDAVVEMFAGLLAGVPTVVVGSADASEPDRLLEAVRRQRVTRLVTVPSLVRATTGAGPSRVALPSGLRMLQLSGEQLPADLATSVRRALPGATIVNLYGSTETGADATAHVLGHEPGGAGPAVPIGTPIDNMVAEVRDGAGRPSPVGTVGQLYLSGPGVCHGYLDGDASRFEDGPAGRTFATGDLARCTPEGVLLYAGRADRMVQVRGARLEPAELEHLLAREPGVEAAWVSLRRRGDEQLLVAHVWPGGGHPPDLEGLRQRLAAHLPRHMLPDLLVPVIDLPRKPTGKVDVARLPLDVAPAGAGTAPPRTGDERALAEIWRRVLGVGEVAVDRSFFVYGGDSLRAFRAAVLARRRFGVPFSVADVFDGPTIAQQVERLQHRRGQVRDPA